MSTMLSYTTTSREATGSIAAKQLRAEGKVPVTLSRRNQPSLHLALDIKTAEDLAKKVVHLCKVTIGKDTVTALKGEISRHCLKDNIEHIDLVQVDEKSEIRVDVVVVPDARNCPGVKSGGIVEQRLRKVRVQCPANAIPDAISLNLDNVKIMESVYANALTLPKGVKLLTNPKFPVLSIVIPRGMSVTAPAAGDAAADPKAAAADPKAAAADPKAAAADPKAAAKKDEKKK